MGKRSLWKGPFLSSKIVSDIKLNNSLKINFIAPYLVLKNLTFQIAGLDVKQTWSKKINAFKIAGEAFSQISPTFRSNLIPK